MSYYSELVKQIPHDDIVFLFISIDSDNDVDKWKERIGSLILPSFSQHYLMNRTSELGTLLNLSSIPRYILIDKNGKIVSFDAPRPSNINEFLNVIKYIRSSSK